MPSPTADFLSLFIVPPGDLLYYLAVFALGQVSLFLAFGQRLRRQRERAPRAYTTAALTIVVVWLVLMVGALVALVSGQGADALLPPMERLAHIITIIALAWAFLTAESERWGRGANLIALALTAFVVLAYVVTGIDWLSVYTTADFNLSSYAAAWAFVSALIAALSLVLVVLDARRIADTPIKIVILTVLVMGFGGTLVQMLNESIVGDYAGGSRITFVAAMLLLPVVIYRAVVAGFERELYEVQEQSKQIRARILAERPAASPSSMTEMEPTLNAPERESGQLMKALGLMLEKADPENIAERVVTASLMVLKGDIGALLTTEDANYADIRVGIDRVMNRPINGISLDLDDQPTLQNAIERRMQRVLHVEHNVDELRDLYTRLDIEQTGPTYFQPLVSNRRLIGVLLIGMPYAGREISDSEMELLKAIGIIGGNLLALGDSALARTQQGQAEVLVPMPYIADDRETVMSETMQGLRAALETARDQIVTLNTQITQMKLELDDERSQVALSLGDTDEGKSVSQRILTLNEEHQQMMDERERLAQRLREAETALASAYTDDNTAIFKTMIDVLGRERDELVAQRERLQTQLVQVRNAQGRENGVPMPDMVREMLERITEEKARTELERDHLGERLEQIESQLTALGIQGGDA